jgi:hypothetical protein
MDVNFWLEMVKYILPSMVMLGGVYLITANFIDNENKKREFELRKQLLNENRKALLPIRMNAYERLLIFLERMNPTSAIHRERTHNMSARDLQFAITNNIREEYEHNLSQQLYVSNEAWTSIINAKEEMVKLYNLVGNNLPDNAGSLEYSKAILDYILSSEKKLPCEYSIDFLKEDIKRFIQ